MSINPLANRPRADASGFGNGLRRLSARDLPYNALSTARRQPGILMHVHPVLPWNLKLQQPQLPRSEPDGQPTESSQLASGGEERTYTTKHGTTADLKRTVIPLARSFERGWKTGVTAPGEAFAPAWHRSRPPSLDRRAVTRHPMTPSDRREPGLQISAGI